jgi:hypothetical protein
MTMAHNLGDVFVRVYYNNGEARFITGAGHCGVEQQAVMNRNFVINSTNPIPGGGSVSVRLYFTDDELAKLIDASLSTHTTYPSTSVALSDPNGCADNDDVRDINEVYVTQISGAAAEDGEFDPNDGVFRLITPARIGPGNGLFGANYVQFNVNQFSEFWLHGTESAFPLPVELLTFTARAVNNTFIQLDWSTATEINNEGFEVQA